MRAWSAVDAVLIRATEIAVVAIGIILTTFLSFGILGRYVAGFSVSFVESGSRFLLVWFFLLGAGLALRLKAHVGFEALQRHLPRRVARIVAVLAHIGSLAFYAMVLAGAQQALSISAATTEPSLGISAVWGMLSVPVGVVLLVYHQIYLLVQDWRNDEVAESRQMTE